MPLGEKSRYITMNVYGGSSAYSKFSPQLESNFKTYCYLQHWTDDTRAVARDTRRFLLIKKSKHTSEIIWLS